MEAMAAAGYRAISLATRGYGGSPAPADPAAYTVGRDTAIIVRLARWLSDRMLDRLLARSLKPHHPNALPATRD